MAAVIETELARDDIALAAGDPELGRVGGVLIGSHVGLNSVPEMMLH